MSRLDDLIDLIRTTNEVYFITAPKRVRTVFILVDDIVELALKSYMQQTSTDDRKACLEDFRANKLASSDRHFTALTLYFNGQLGLSDLPKKLGINGADAEDRIIEQLDKHSLIQHWSLNDSDAQTSFDALVMAVKEQDDKNTELSRLLDEDLARHKQRNGLYHDPNKAPLTVDDLECLRALRDLFQLMEHLFPLFRQILQANRQHLIVRYQIGVLRLKLDAIDSEELQRPYSQALRQVQSRRLASRIKEHIVLHTVSEDFLDALRDRFDLAISKLAGQTAEIDTISSPSSADLRKRATCERKRTLLQDELDIINSL